MTHEEDAKQSLPACLGGWCPVRDRCERHLTNEREHVVERLCAPGKERPVPLRLLPAKGESA